MASLQDNRWAIRLWIAAIGAWLVMDASRSWHYSSSEHRPVPVNSVTATLTDRYAVWFKKFADSPKRSDGLPATDLADIFQKPDQPLLRPPATKRANGNRLELYRQKDGPTVSYDVSGDKGLIVIETNQPVTKFTSGDNMPTLPLLRLPGAVAVESGHLPLSFFEGTFRDRQTVLQLFDASGKMVHFLSLGMEHSAEITFFKGTKPQSPLGPKYVEQLLLSPEQRRKKTVAEFTQHFDDVRSAKDIAAGHRPATSPRSCTAITPITISSNLSDKAVVVGSLGYQPDPQGGSLLVSGLPIAPRVYALEIDAQKFTDRKQPVQQSVTVANNSVAVRYADLPSIIFDDAYTTELRLKAPGNASPVPDARISLHRATVRDIRLCHDNPSAKLGPIVGKP